MLLKHKTSIITGCNRGIGLHILETFAQNGANVFACYRKKSDQIIDNCKNLSKKFGVKVYPVFFDSIKDNPESISQNSISIRFSSFVASKHPYFGLDASCFFSDVRVGKTSFVSR